MKPGSEVFHEHFGAYGKGISHLSFVENCVSGLTSGEYLKVEHIVVYVL